MYDWARIIKQEPSMGELISITHYVLSKWTNRDLCAYGYDKTALELYHNFFGKMLKWAEIERKKESSKYIEFINMWSYQGKIYRVQGKKMIFRKDREEPYLRRCGLQYHKLT